MSTTNICFRREVRNLLSILLDLSRAVSILQKKFFWDGDMQKLCLVMQYI